MKSCNQPQKYQSCEIQGDKGIGCLPGEQLKSAHPNFSGAANICTVQPSGAAGLSMLAKARSSLQAPRRHPDPTLTFSCFDPVQNLNFSC